eukprot:m.136047 g.136047  ORF g.136047 m.136047 type:complete len:367 (+) comp16965_c1_seq7:5096-6196(+)
MAAATRRIRQWSTFFFLLLNVVPSASLELGESVTMMCAGPASHDSVVVLGNQEPGLEVSAADGKAIRQFKPEEYGGFAGIRAWTAYCACFGSGQLALGYDKDVSVADIGQSSIDTVGKSTVAANVLCMAAVGEDRMAFGLENGSIALVDNKGTVVSTIKQAHQKKVNHVTSYDDTTIVSVGEDHHLRVWDITKPSKAKKEVEIKSEMELYHPTHGILLDDKKAIVTVQSIIRVFDLDSQETIAQEKFCQQTLIGSVGGTRWHTVGLVTVRLYFLFCTFFIFFVLLALSHHGGPPPTNKQHTHVLTHSLTYCWQCSCHGACLCQSLQACSLLLRQPERLTQTDQSHPPPPPCGPLQRCASWPWPCAC